VIGQEEIQRVARQWQIQDYVIEKDYVLGWLLWGISQHPVLSQAWVLKGGSAIKKCYVDTHRYSQDLDFTVLPGAPWQPDELRFLFNDILSRVNQEVGIDFSVQEPSAQLS
jgi:predicted nucleotidyltransferase component of viral defense system